MPQAGGRSAARLGASPGSCKSVCPSRSILHFCRMLSTRQDTDILPGLRPKSGFSRVSYLTTVPPVAGTDGDRSTFRRRLGLSLAAFRRAAGYGQQQQGADELGVNVETLGRWERGTKEPKAYELHRM